MTDAPTPSTPSPADAPRALPARTGGSRALLSGDWIVRLLDIVEMMADATREALLGGRKR